MQTLTEAGLLNSADSARERLTEFFIGHHVGEVTEAQRHEKFSFAALCAFCLESTQQLQDMLDTKSTAERLTAAYNALADDTSYIAAKRALQDLF